MIFLIILLSSTISLNYNKNLQNMYVFRYQTQTFKVGTSNVFTNVWIGHYEISNLLILKLDLDSSNTKLFIDSNLTKQAVNNVWFYL